MTVIARDDDARRVGERPRARARVGVHAPYINTKYTIKVQHTLDTHTRFSPHPAPPFASLRADASDARARPLLAPLADALVSRLASPARMFRRRGALLALASRARAGTIATTTTGARDDDDDRSGRCGGCGR